MQTTDNETVLDKAVNFVKDAFGIERAAPPEVVGDPEHHDTEQEQVAENAMSLDPNAYVVNSAGDVTPSEQLMPGTFATPMGESDAERLRREVDEHPREMTPQEHSSELVKRENGF